MKRLLSSQSKVRLQKSQYLLDKHCFTLNTQECYFMNNGENGLSTVSVFIFMKSIYSSHCHCQRTREQVAKPFHGQCLYQAISPQAKWIIQYDGVKIRNLILMLSVISSHRVGDWNKQWFYHTVPSCTNIIHIQ